VAVPQDNLFHLAPVERIGSIYTPSASTLTMSVARRVQDKEINKSPTNSKKSRRHVAAVTAPAAYELSAQLQNNSYELDEGDENDEFDRQVPFAVSGSRGYNDRPFVPDVDSNEAQREKVFAGRSPPKMPVIQVSE
tara:strand:- start:137 stop:544 length:408 start_codon:yes stop_codon:yes gene_type:complete